MKTCPYCAEPIEDAAIKCKHCREFLDQVGGPPPVPPGSAKPMPAGDRLPWYFQTVVVVIALLSVGPLALPMVWWHPRMRVGMKVGISVGIVVLTWGLVWAAWQMIQFLMEQWEALSTM